MLAFLLNFLKKIFVICLATKKPCRVPSFISCYEVKLGHFSNLYFSLGTHFTQPPPPPPPENPEITKMCTCRKKDLEKDGCPLNGVCMTPEVIYGATVKILDMSGEPIEMTKETYTGLSEPPWKQRKYGHNTDFKHKRIGTSKKGTTLSKYIWTLKDPDDCNVEPCPNKIDHQIKWKILARAKGYNPITGLCRLCLQESYFLLFKPETASLNKRSEIFTPCPHRKFKFLDNAKIT